MWFSTALIALLAPAPVVSNDGALTAGGSPKLMSAHPSIRMESEVIRIVIKDGKASADCRFEFVNDGPACDVQMGFPDRGFGAGDPYEEMDKPWKDMPIKTVFHSFRSWVDGEQVRPDIVKGSVEGEIYRAKQVHFAAGARVRVRDTYVVDEGSGVAPDGDRSCSEVGYVLQTGGSWKGKIRSSTVIFEFEPKRPIREFVFGDISKLKFKMLKNGKQGALCAGPVRPTLKNNRLTFVMKNWRPKPESDIFIQYAASKN